MGVFGRRRGVHDIDGDELAATDPTVKDSILADHSLPDRDWTALPPDTHRWQFAAPSGQLAGLSSGPHEGEHVLLLPGVTGSKEDFVIMIPLLTAAGYRVHAVDLAGQYESNEAGPDSGIGYDDELFAADVLALLEWTGPAHVLGYSFAGTIAQMVLIRRPELFRSLALLSAPPLAGNSFRGIKFIGPLSRFASPNVAASLMLWGIRNNLNRVSPGRVRLARHRLVFTRRQSVVDVMQMMMHTPDLASAVWSLPLPKLVAAGKHDLWPAARHRIYAASIGATFVEYDTGHSPCETTPHQLCQDLLTLYLAAD